MVTNTPTLLDRLRARLRDAKTNGESGSLILDILIGMAIFALIAIIAVSAISQYRMRAYEQGAVSDAKATGLALEANYTDTQSYPTVNGSLTDQASLDAALGDGAVNLTKGVAVNGYVQDGSNFALCLEHSSDGNPDAFAVYASLRGGIVDKGRGTGCDPVTTATLPGLLFPVTATEDTDDDTPGGTTPVAVNSIDPNTGCDLKVLVSPTTVQYTPAGAQYTRAMGGRYSVNPACIQQAFYRDGLSADPAAVAAVQAEVAGLFDTVPVDMNWNIPTGGPSLPIVFGFIHAESFNWPAIPVDGTTRTGTQWRRTRSTRTTCVRRRIAWRPLATPSSERRPTEHGTDRVLQGPVRSCLSARSPIGSV
jgi:type II secretory pathway pseudopilin PulG